MGQAGSWMLARVSRRGLPVPMSCGPPPKLLLIGSDDHTPVVVPRADYAFMFLSSFWYDSALLRTASIRVG
ncbi:Uncharacterised protein [Mycobacteroides abscessus subsp. abscessus]|nr:Uncharacterised protein [Mycobacteroides abscessus subsp. abscessus]SHY49172.1 Uncharacterised protein [Mycobacteroides abscessus subsp. abscessus]SHY55411.1 Uncharacterised protein [Mycobacteroides abscessus subsp. abscessus]SHY62744.1 Uncharacterised protein [Mycobacteroides abscessus subsp. abscessus]SIA07666.1 Uncharacterised protein [Mycobacteroides abscessus subsp. abscessus]